MSDRRRRHKWGRFGGKNEKAPTIRTTATPPEAGQGKFVVSATLTVLVMVGAAVGMAFLRAERPDPHYTKATTMINKYETTRSPDRRNYGHEVYGTALDELAMVDPESVSADPAQRLDNELRKKIAAFRAQLLREQKQKQGVFQARRDKRAISYARRLEARRNPRTYFPECGDEEGGDHSHSGHKH